MTAKNAAAARRLSEEQFQRRITDLCTWLQLAWHHETDSRRSHAGFPDLVIVGDGDRGVVFAELKSDTGVLEPEQQWWLDRLTLAGLRAYVWRPKDWPEVELIIRELAGR